MSILIPAVAAVLLAVLCLPRWRKDPGGPVAVPEPERIATVTAVAVEPRPSASPTRPFAYDDGLMIGEKT